jgi:hypothetical protein
MNTIENLFTSIDKQLSDFVFTMHEVLPEDIGLDKRAAYRLYLCEQGLAVHKTQDSNLQYYGGFEYIDKEYRVEYGEWVFYTLGDSDERVENCIERYFNEEMSDEPTTEPV